MVNIKSDKGTISISSEVLTYLAGVAATSCFGVKGMIGRSKDGGAWQLLRRESMSKGVTVHFDEDGAIALELHIGVDHGVNMSAVAKSIVNEVSYKLSQSTGVPVRRVDVFIDTIISDKAKRGTVT
ncbi:MAG: Asp23/Gls24 family envelope stress response protein [Oscillospiraceae bacterium]|nr:Asp23/Gls24 family envelope stress response protein [Oscillospiraceae bacterium]